MEEWRPIAGYDGLYEVSNLGRVRRIAAHVTTKNGRICLVRGRIIALQTRNRGYKTVRLCKDGKGKTVQVHRLVASAFLENEQNLPMIDHINCDPSDNRANNLRWCTPKENSNNPITLKHIRDSRLRGADNPNFGKKRPEEFSLKLSKVLKGRKFSEETLAKFRAHLESCHKKGGESQNAKRVAQYNRSMELIREWDCITDAAKSLGVTPSAITCALKKDSATCRKSIWKYI